MSASRAVERAAAYLRSNLAGGAWSTGARLPTIGDLAAVIGVSASSVWKAIRILRKEDLVTVRRGSRIIAGSPEETCQLAASSPRLLLWERKRNALRNDLLGGLFGTGKKLPPLGMLSDRYSVCPATMRKILAALVEEGTVHRCRRALLAPRPKIHTSNTYLVLVVDRVRIGEESAEHSRLLALVTLLEQECSRRGISSHLIQFDSRDPDVLAHVRAQIPKTGVVLGFVLDLWWAWVPETAQRLLDLIHFLASRQKPVAIFDEISAFSFPYPLSVQRTLRIFRLAGKTAGLAAARYVMNLGHARVAYISYCHIPAWSIQRYAGACEAFEQAGRRDSLVPFLLTEVNGQWELALSLFDYSPREFARIFGRILSKEQTEDLLARFRHIRTLNIFGNRKSGTLRQLCSCIHHTRSLSRLDLDKQLFAELFDAYYECVNQRVIGPYLEPLFGRIAEDRSITAWIVAQDNAAIAALESLRGKGIRVPEDVSVFSFDNTRKSLQHSLTSFDFNITGVASQALNFVLFPPKNRDECGPQIVEVEGIICDRGSTRRA